MNRNVARALAQDAFYQVVDNWVFRILAVLTALPILMTFLIGLREDGIVLLFGLKTWSYADAFGSFGGASFLKAADQRAQLIEITVQIVVDFLAGSLGMLPCIVATSFFVPRMLEKGAADLYFHKPVSRGALLLSRYFAGLLFVALVAVVLVGGMYLGFLLVSRRNDPGFLMAAPSLIYVFALVYSFSMLTGVVTRSTVATILLSSMFFLFNGCIQKGWIAVQQTTLGPRIDFRHGEERGGPSSPKSSTKSSTESSTESTPKSTTASETGEADPPPDPADEAPSMLARVFRGTLDTLHYVLPKTSDADYFGQKVRQALARPDFRDEHTLVAVFRLPEELHPLESAGLAAPEPASLHALLGEACYAAAGAGETATIYSLWRRPGEARESRIKAGERLQQELASTEALREVVNEPTRFGAAGHGDLPASLVRWKSGAAEATRTHAGLVFKAGDQVFTLLVDVAGERTSEELTAAQEFLTDRMGIDQRGAEDWYTDQLGFTAPLPFNIFFSIGSSLAFALVMLLLARWRLGRIAF